MDEIDKLKGIFDGLCKSAVNIFHNEEEVAPFIFIFPREGEIVPVILIKKDKEKAGSILYVAAQIVKALAVTAYPFVPSTAEQMWQTLNMSGEIQKIRWEVALKPLEPKHKISKPKPLFKKIEADETKLEARLAQIREDKLNQFTEGCKSENRS